MFQPVSMHIDGYGNSAENSYYDMIENIFYFL
jgi:hypothetical protein